MNKELEMWVENGVVVIKVKDGYEYEARIQGIGNIDDSPSGFTLWAWINHLRSKNWWNFLNERNFIELAMKLIKQNG